MKKILLFILLIIFLIPNAYANTCTTEEVRRLTELANRVKVNYEVGKIWVDNLAYETDGGPEKLEIDNFYLNIYNLNKDLFIIVTNNKNSEKLNITYDLLKNGKYSLDTQNNVYYITEYTFKIYAQNDPCRFRELKTIKYTKPITNQLYFYDECKNNLDIPICSQFITKPINLNPFELKKYIDEYKKNNTMKNTTKNDIDNDNYKTIYKYYILGFFFIIGLSTISLIIYKKRRKL